jgi:hypothetical protein
MARGAAPKALAGSSIIRANNEIGRNSTDWVVTAGVTALIDVDAGARALIVNSLTSIGSCASLGAVAYSGAAVLDKSC